MGECGMETGCVKAVTITTSQTRRFATNAEVLKEMLSLQRFKQREDHRCEKEIGSAQAAATIIMRAEIIATGATRRRLLEFFIDISLLGLLLCCLRSVQAAVVLDLYHHR